MVKTTQRAAVVGRTKNTSFALGRQGTGGEDEEDRKLKPRVRELEMIEDEPDPKARELLRQCIGWTYQQGDTAEIEVEHLLTYLQVRQQQRLLCMRLPFTLALYIVFICTVLWHEDISSASLLNRQLQDTFEGANFEGVEHTSGHKSFYDISTKEDFYLFLREGLLPTFLHENPTAIARREGYAELHRVLRYNRLIGGVQLQQKRWSAWQCRSRYLGYQGTRTVMGNVTCFGAPGVDDCFGPLRFGVREPNARSVTPSGFCGDRSSEGYGQLVYSPSAAEDPPASEEANATGDASANTSNTSAPNRSSAALASEAASWRGGADPVERTGVGDEGSGGGEAPARRMRMAKSKQKAKPAAQVGALMNPGVRFLESDTFSVMFSEDGGLPNAMEKLTWLEESEWIDLQTQWLGVNIFVLNPELSMYGHATVNVYMGPSGELLPFLKIRTFSAEPYEYLSILVIDVVFVLLILQLMVVKWARLGHSAWRGELIPYLKLPWHWVQILVAHGGLVIVAMFGTAYALLHGVKERTLQVALWLSRRRTALAAAAGADAAAPSGAAEGLMAIADDQAYVKLLLDLHREVKDFTDYLADYRGVLAVYGLVLMVGFFRVFQMQPRLAMIANTLLRSWSDTFHHMIVLVTLWLAFTFSGVLILGKTVFSFASLELACAKTATMLLGDFDWEEISNENPALVAAWLWIFLSLMMLVIMNMFMAILMDVYAEVKGMATAQEPLWVQLYGFVEDWYLDRDEIGPRALERILQRISKRQEVKRISPRLLLWIVPGMSKEQAMELIQSAQLYRDIQTGKTMTLSEMHQLIRHIHIQLHGIVKKTQDLVTQMRAEMEENRQVAERRKAEAERRAEEMGDMLSKERWEPSRRFMRRAQMIEDTMARMESFAEDSMAWLGYRGRQATDYLVEIERLARERTGIAAKAEALASDGFFGSHRPAPGSGPTARPSGVRSVLSQLDEEPPSPRLQGGRLHPLEDHRVPDISPSGGHAISFEG